MNRRSFLQMSAAAAVLRPQFVWPETARHFPIGLQLSTLVKHQVDQAEMVSNLQQIAAIGSNVIIVLSGSLTLALIIATNALLMRPPSYSFTNGNCSPSW